MEEKISQILEEYGIDLLSAEDELIELAAVDIAYQLKMKQEDVFAIFKKMIDKKMNQK